MDDPVKLEFKLQDKTDPKRWTRPKWVEAEVKNATCPNCGKLMMVVDRPILYAICTHCNQYFIGG